MCIMGKGEKQYLLAGKHTRRLKPGDFISGKQRPQLSKGQNDELDGRL